MSEQELKSGGGAGSSVVLVEQSATSRHKQPFRPVDMQEDAQHDLHHKRSKAPAVPSVAEDLKDNINSEIKDRKESDRAMSSEKHKHSVAKMLSSSKRRSSFPETITLAPLEVDTKKGAITPPPQPIPAQVSSVPSSGKGISTSGKHGAQRRDDEDSITEELPDLRTSEAAKVSEQWAGNATETKKKEVSWDNSDYLDKVQLEDVTKSQPCVLERKSSIGPCFRSSGPFGRPSGISVCLSKKSRSMINEECNHNQSVINITVSKKCFINKTISLSATDSAKEDATKNTANEIQDIPKVSFFGALRQKIANMGDRIKHVFA